MAGFVGGMEFPAGRAVRIALPPAVVPATAVRVTCRTPPVVKIGEHVQAGQALAEPVDAPGTTDPIAPGRVCPMNGHVRAITAWRTEAGRRLFDVSLLPTEETVTTALPLLAPRGRALEDWFAAVRRLGGWPQPGVGADLVAQLAAAIQRRPTLVICLGLDAFAPYPDRTSLLMNFPDDVALGTKLLREITGARRARVLGPADRKVVARLRRRCRNFRVRYVPVQNIYPAADPTLVAFAHGPGSRLGRGPKVAHGANPVAAAGIVMVTPWTVIRLARWLTRGQLDLVQPVMLGDARPQSRARASMHWAIPGQPLAALDASLREEAEHRALAGNPMTGRPLPTPMTDAGPLPAAVPEDEHLVSVIAPPPPAPAEPCISCGWCVDVCPTRLRPIHLAELAERGSDDAHLNDRLPWCIDCGLCTHVCPSHLPLAQTLRAARHRLEGRR